MSYLKNVLSMKCPIMKCFIYEMSYLWIVLPWDVLCILSMKWLIYEMSYLWNVLFMKCPIYEMSYLWNVQFMKCPLYEMSYLWNVLSMKCPIYEMSHLWNLWYLKCPVYDFVIHEIPLYEMSLRKRLTYDPFLIVFAGRGTQKGGKHAPLCHPPQLRSW